MLARFFFWLCAVPAVIAANTPSAIGVEEAEKNAPDEVSYYRDIRPIFQANCHGCHQPAKASGDYVMTDFQRLVAGGESELAAVVPNKVGDSYLVDLITPDDGEAEMPKGKMPLADHEVELVRKWIEAGAQDDTPQSAENKYDADNPPVYRLPPVVTALDYSPDGKLLAVSGNHEILLHNAIRDADGAGPVARLVGLSERIESIAFSPDGKLLAATGGLPGRMGEVQIWNVEKRALERSIPLTYDTVYGASWSPEGKLLAVGCADNSVRAFDAATGKQVLFQGAHNDWVLDTVFSLDGKHLGSASRDRSMKLIEVKTQRFIDNITSIVPGAAKGGLAAVDRHPTKDEVLTGGADGTPQTFNMFRQKSRQRGKDFDLIRKYDEMPGRIFAVEYSPDGKHLVAGSSFQGAGELRVYVVNDGKQVWKRNTTPIYTATYSPDGKTIAAAGFEGTVWLLDAATGEPVRDFVPVPLNSAEVAAADSSATDQ